MVSEGSVMAKAIADLVPVVLILMLVWAALAPPRD
jgi:hypothetical protein